MFDSSDQYRKRWKHVQYLADQFWRKWLKLYVPELQRRIKWTKTMDDIKVKDLVLICDQFTPRNLWPMAIVQEVYPSKDNLVRSVKIRTRTGCLVRPITKLVRLESADEFNPNNVTNDKS